MIEPGKCYKRYCNNWDYLLITAYNRSNVEAVFLEINPDTKEPRNVDVHYRISTNRYEQLEDWIYLRDQETYKAMFISKLREFGEKLIKQAEGM